MPAYISARFEKSTLIVSDQTRVIVRNLDDGGVPPSPSAIYFPTDPDDYRSFIVAEYAGDSLGETFVRAALLADFTTYTYRPMNQFEDSSGNLALALVGDTLEIYPVDTTLWTSEEYPSSNFIFTITSLVDAFNVLVSPELPAFKTGLSWEIRRNNVSITQGTVGATRRSGLTYGLFPPVQPFLEKRFNAYFSSSVAAQNFVEATKAEMTGLANALLNAQLSSENFTAEPTV